MKLIAVKSKKFVPTDALPKYFSAHEIELLQRAELKLSKRFSIYSLNGIFLQRPLKLLDRKNRHKVEFI